MQWKPWVASSETKPCQITIIVVTCTILPSSIISLISYMSSGILYKTLIKRYDLQPHPSHINSMIKAKHTEISAPTQYYPKQWFVKTACLTVWMFKA
jgi:hypothetical protein